MRTITFYSYKGGTGRSLTVANAALYLQRLNFRVAVIDFDLEAPGLHYKFAFDPEKGRLPVTSGLVDYIYEFVMRGEVPDQIAKLVIRLGNGQYPELYLIAAGNAPEPGYWQKLSRINWHELFYSDNNYGVGLFFDLKNKIQHEIKPDFLLIDSRTGITEMGGVATSLLADRVICLVSSSRENLEGARAVLQSVNRTRRSYNVSRAEFTIALSRLPEMEKVGGETEVIGNILRILNQESESLEDTLSIKEDDAVTLHSENALEIREALRIGSGVSPEDSVLLRDYLRLFASIVPKDIVGSKLQSMMAKAREKIWDNPTDAVKEVEELAESFGHPDTYRELLRFYQVRNVRGPIVLRRAQRLWEIARYYSSDDVLWNTLVTNFPASESRWVRETDSFQPRTDFVEAVWRDAGKRNANYGLRLAAHYDDDSDNHARAIAILTEMIDHEIATLDVVVRCINLLVRAGKGDEARSLIEQFRGKYEQESTFISAWLRYTSRYRDVEYAQTLLHPPYSNSAEKSDPLSLLILSLSMGLKQEARALAQRSLDHRILREFIRGSRDVDELFHAFSELGLSREFFSALRPILPPGELRRLRSRHGIVDSENTEDE